MPDTINPPKDTVQDMERRTHAPLDPPPTVEEIRRQLGWHLLLHNRRPDRDNEP